MSMTALLRKYSSASVLDGTLVANAHKRVMKTKRNDLSCRLLKACVAAWLLCSFVAPRAAAPPPGAVCTATVLNRSVGLKADGTIEIPNVPFQPGFYRVRVTCLSGGTTLLGQSDYFLLNPNGVTTIGHIQYGVQSPLPVSMSIASPETSLTTKGETVQMMAHVTYADGSIADVNLPAQGIFWTSSNPFFATVDENGLVTAHERGPVNIIALNEGVQASFALQIDIPNDADGDGLTDDWERANGFNPNDAGDAGQDFDSDGLSNLQEFLRGTNP